MIVFSSVTKIIKKRPIIDGVSFRIDPGEMLCVTGPSGAGKSTLVHLLIGAERPSKGAVQVDGVDLARVPHGALQLFRRRTGVVFQDYKLLADLTVRENIALPLEVCGETNAVIKQRVPEVLADLGIDHIAQAFPNEISGGEKARVALARAIVHRPMILVADEPTGNIDPKQSLKILELFKKIHQSGVTVILATHDQELVDALQTRVIRIEGGRLVRDSIGGYEHEQKVEAPTEPGERKHEIFQRKAAKKERAAFESLNVDVATDKANGEHVKPVSVG